MKVKPLGNRVLLKVIDEEEKRTPGGIVLPDTAKDDRVIRGEVLAVGTGEKVELKKGDVVLVSRYGGTELEIDREKLLIVKAADVLAVVQKPSKKK